MTDIRPFKALRYVPGLGPLEALLAPPYDVITEEYRRALLARHERNIASVILKDPGDGASGYERIGRTFAGWRDDGTIVQDTTPAIYLLEQRFSVDGRSYTRTGILARFKVEPSDSKAIRPHEKTRGPAKEDRFSVLKATRVNFSPIFLFFEDDGGFSAAATAVKTQTPAATYVDDEGITHVLWAVTEPTRASALATAAGKRADYIADGHHRYATAQRYLKEVGPEGGVTYGYFCPKDDGLLVLPYHRILAGAPALAVAQERLQGKYLLNRAANMEEAARQTANSTLPFAFAIAWPNGEALVCEAAPGIEDDLPAEAPSCLKDLDTYFLHQVAFKHLGVSDASVEFVHSLQDARAELVTNPAAAAILMRATPLRHIEAVADASESMPPKSTFFHPKIPSGLLIHPLEA